MAATTPHINPGDLNFGAGGSPVAPDIPIGILTQEWGDLTHQFAAFVDAFSGGLLAALVPALLDGGLRSSRKYRLMLIQRYWTGADKARKTAFVALMLMCQIVPTKPRIQQMNLAIGDAALRGAVTALLNLMANYNADRGGNVLFTPFNLRSAFPEAGVFLKMAMFGARDTHFVVTQALLDKFNSGNLSEIAADGTRGNQINAVPAGMVLGQRIAIRAYMTSPGFLQLDVPIAEKERARLYAINLWETQVLTRNTRVPVGWSDEWYFRTSATDRYRMPHFWGQVIPVGPMTIATLDALAGTILNELTTNVATAAGNWGNFAMA